MNSRSLIVLIALFCFSGCGNNQSPEESFEQRLNKNDSTDEVNVFSSDHKEMNEAYEKARRSYRDFLKALETGCDGCSGFYVKMRFKYGESNGEHIWIEDLRIVDDKLYGTIANIPENIENLKYGDTVEVVEKNLSDWKYVQNGKLVGWFTLRVMYNKMSEEEKKQLESELKVRIE